MNMILERLYMKKIINVKIEDNKIIIYEKNNEDGLNTQIDIHNDSHKPFEEINDFILKNINEIEIDFSNLKIFNDKEATIYKVAEKICESYEKEIKDVKKNMGLIS